MPHDADTSGDTGFQALVDKASQPLDDAPFRVDVYDFAGFDPTFFAEVVEV